MKVRIAAVMLTLLALAALAQWCGLTGLHTPAERAAIARLRVPLAPLGERNAYAALWLGRFEMPEERYAAQLAEDVTRWRALQRIEDPKLRRARRFAFDSGARERYPALPGMYGWPVLCFAWEPNCLQRVRADPEPMRRMLERVGAYLPRLQRLARYDHLSNPFQHYGSGVSPRLGTMFGTLLSDVALRHVDGDPDASTRLCEVTATLRRLRGRSDDLALINSTQRLLAGAQRLYADLRAELPPDAPPPDSCTTAFAPLADAELDLCRPWQQQFLAEPGLPDPTALSGPDGPSMVERIGWAVSDYEVDDPGWARLLDQSYCSSERADRNRRRVRLEFDPGLLLCGAGERLFHPAPCATKEVQLERFGVAQDQVLDLDARFTLAALASRLALLPDSERRKAFAERARTAIEDTHPFALEADSLSAPLLYPDSELRIVVPLPGSGRRAAQDSGSERR